MELIEHDRWTNLPTQNLQTQIFSKNAALSCLILLNSSSFYLLLSTLHAPSLCDMAVNRHSPKATWGYLDHFTEATNLKHYKEISMWKKTVRIPGATDDGWWWWCLMDVTIYFNCHFLSHWGHPFTATQIFSWVACPCTHRLSRLSPNISLLGWLPLLSGTK